MFKGSTRRLCSLAPSQDATAAKSYDVVVAGAGMVGAAAARGIQMILEQQQQNDQSSDAMATSQKNIKTDKILLVDSVPKQPQFDTDNVFHKLRTVSITPMSSNILHNLGVWDGLQHRHAFHRMAIRHEEQVRSSSLANQTAAAASIPHFVNTFLPSAASSTGQKRGVAPLLEFLDLDTPMGHICCNDEIQANLVSKLVASRNEEEMSNAGVECLFNTQLSGLRAGSSVLANGAQATGNIVQGGAAKEAPVTTTPFTSKLLLGCEGRAVGAHGTTVASVVAPTTWEKDYQQMAFVCSVELEGMQDGNVSAFQNFFNDGRIIAFLPSGPNTTNIVFSTSVSGAKKLLPGGDSADESSIVAYLNSMLCEFAPRDIPKIKSIVKMEVSGKSGKSGGGGAEPPKLARGAFPLKLKLATVPYVSRAMLLGDAAHGVHPLAGQGLNMGLYDVASLVDNLRDAHEAGEDIGSELVLSRVSHKMMMHTAPVIAGMELIKTTMTATPTLAGLGMQFLNHIPLVKEKGLQYLGSGKHLYDPKSVLFC